MDHLVLLGATYHVPQKGATVAEIGEVVARAGGAMSIEEIAAALARLVDSGHVERVAEDRYRASSHVVDWFRRTHRCYSGIEADAENLREMLGHSQ